jgi:prophage antirepressor-like protein
MPELNPTYPITLSFDQHPITVLTDEDGAPWWFADEVCAALGLSHLQALSRLDDDEKGIRITDTPGGPQRKATINESGLYSLILRSRKPEAKRFKRWVTHEVLPQIRKTGAYTAPEAPTLATREADLSALTDAVSAIVPALTAITTTLSLLATRVDALEASPKPSGPPPQDLDRLHRMVEQRRAAGRKGGLAKTTNKAARQAAAESPLALPAPAVPPLTPPPTEWSGVPVEVIVMENLHLAGAGSWLYGVVADLDAEVSPRWTFRPGVSVRGTNVHPGPGAYAWSSGEWIHVHVSADIWRPHLAGDQRATWLIGQIVDRYQRHVEALRIVETERRKLPREPNGRYPNVAKAVEDEAVRAFYEDEAA